MSDQFLGEIRMFAGNYAPAGWALCDGSLLAISTNSALFSLLGTTYGGDAKTTFALPDLRAASPMQQGQGPGLSLRALGEFGGESTVTLLQSEMPLHTHSTASNADTNVFNATLTSPSGARRFANAGATSIYNNSSSVNLNSAGVQMSPLMLSIAGGNQPHNNMQPYLAVTFIIALTGIFPARS